MRPIETPFKTFSCLDGAPLDDGFVYIGQPDQNPETAPLTVYWDAAGTQPAAQPLRTLNGYICRAGTPANVYVGGGIEYSLTVRDTARTLIYYEKRLGGGVVSTFNGRSGDITLLGSDLSNAFGFSPAVSVLNVAAVRLLDSASIDCVSTKGYLSGGDGGHGDYYFDATDTASTDNGGSVLVAGNGARWKLASAQVYNARQFGARGNGTSDDTAALQAFANFLCVGSKRGHIPAGRYRTTQRVVFPGSCVIEGDGWAAVRDQSGPATRDWALAQTIGTIIYGDYTSFDVNHSSVFRMEGMNVTMRDIEFEARQPLPGPGWTTANTPYALDFYRVPYAEQGGNDTLLENIMLRNFKNGIQMVGSSRGTVRGLYGQCFGSFISVTQCYDVLRIEDAHLNWPFYSGQADVLNYQNANAQAIVFGRVDNPILSNIFVFGGRAGIVTYIDTAANGGKTERMQINNMGLDNVAVGLDLRDCVTIDLANFYVYCRNMPNSRGIYSHAELGGGQVPLRINLVNGDFQGSMAEAMRFEVPGNVQMANIRIRDYDQATTGASGIYAADGVHVQYVNLVNEFPGTGLLTEAVGTGSITGGAGGGGGSAGVASFNTRSGVVTLNATDVANAIAPTARLLTSPSTLRSTDKTTPSAGTGTEMLYDQALNSGFILSYDRSANVFKDLTISGTNISFQSGAAGAVQGSFDSNGYFLLGYSVSAGAYKLQVNGPALVGPLTGTTAAFSGPVTMPTAAPGTNTTQGATTAFVTAAVAAGGGGGSGGPSFAATIRSTTTVDFTTGVGLELNYDTTLNAGFLACYDRTGAVYKDLNVGGRTITFKCGATGVNQALFDTSGYLLLGYNASVGSYKLQINGDAICSGAMFAATPATSTTGTRVATCDYVISKIAAGGVTAFNGRTGAVALNSSDVTTAVGSLVTAFNTRSGAISLTSADVTGALGGTPALSGGPAAHTTVSASQTIRSTGTLNPGSGTGVEVNYDTSLSAGFVIAYDRSSSAYRNLNFGGFTIGFKTGSGSNAGSFDQNGSLLLGYNVTNGTSYLLQVNSQIYATSAAIATSDRRVKQDIKPLGDATALVLALEPVTYQFRQHAVHNFPSGTQVGFIAQDVDAALAGTDYAGSLVATNEDGDENLMGLAETKMIPLLVKTIQEMEARVRALEGRQ